MKKRIKGFLLLLLALITQFTFAQDMTISGVVSDSNGLPIPGVNVKVKGTSTGTSTDFDGSYKIKAKTTDVLVFSFQGMNTQELKVSGTKMNARLATKSTELEGIVVTTAFGIKRNPKKLGYAVSTVATSDLTENSEPDLSRALSGKVAGVNVNVSSGVAGAANQITIRGTTTFNGNTQPLIIVDGIAYNNNEVTTSSQTTGGGGYGSGLSSLDPNDIASFTVLKSSAAAALYGSRAVNGVIVVTTKSGGSGNKKSKVSVNVGLGTYFEDIANLPEYQNSYGAGSNFSYANANGSWGPKFGTVNGGGIDANGTFPTWPNYLAAFPNIVGSRTKYEAKPNNVKDLFRTGLVQDRTIGLNYANEDGNFSTTISKLDQDGYIPFNNFGRTSISAGGNFKLGSKLTVGANLSFSRTNQIGAFFGENQFQGAASSFARTLLLARNWDFSLPYNNPNPDLTTAGSVTPNTGQFDHPLWSWENDKIITVTNRIVTGFNANYKFNKNISASYRVGFNKYDLDRDEIRNLRSRAANLKGQLKRDIFQNQDLESTLLVNFDYKLSEKIGFNAIVGNNVLQNKTLRTTNQGDEFKVPNIFTLNNVKTITNLEDTKTTKRNVGFFTDVTLSYKDYFFLNGTARNDLSSSLPKKNNSYFYYSGSGSLVLTDALNLKNNVLTFAKLRAGYAKVGRDADSEFTNITYVIGNSYNSNATISNDNELGDQKITPEFTNEFEFGFDLEFFRKRVVIDFTSYKKVTTDLITPVTTASSSGFDTFKTNIGEMENKGIEIGLTLIPIKTDNFQWTSFTTFTKNKNTVNTLKPGLERFNLQANTVSYVIPGESFGVFYGTKYARDNQGNYLINPSGGGIIQSPELGVIGDPNADFKMSFTNTFAYKGFSLRSQIDWKKGGDVFSTTIQSLLGRGVTKDTEDREKTNIIPGFYGNTNGTPILDVNGNQIPNTIQITTNDLYFSPGTNNNTFGINSVDEASVYDGTIFRLRELSFGYDVPSKFLKNTLFSNISFSILGNNLWYFAPNVPKYTNFDPETTSYGSTRIQGVELSAAPTAKRYGFKLNLTF